MSNEDSCSETDIDFSYSKQFVSGIRNSWRFQRGGRRYKEQ